MPIYTLPPHMREPSPLKRVVIFTGKCIIAAGFIFAIMAIVAMIGLSLNAGL